MKHSSSIKISVFSRTGFKDWTHGMPIFKKHEQSYIHQEAWIIRNSGTKSRSTLLVSNHITEVEENRSNLQILIETLLLTAN